MVSSSFQLSLSNGTGVTSLVGLGGEELFSVWLLILCGVKLDRNKLLLSTVTLGKSARR